MLAAALYRLWKAFRQRGPFMVGETVLRLGNPGLIRGQLQPPLDLPVRPTSAPPTISPAVHIAASRAMGRVDLPRECARAYVAVRELAGLEEPGNRKEVLHNVATVIVSHQKTEDGTDRRRNRGCGVKNATAPRGAASTANALVPASVRPVFGFLMRGTIPWRRMPRFFRLPASSRPASSRHCETYARAHSEANDSPGGAGSGGCGNGGGDCRRCRGRRSRTGRSSGGGDCPRISRGCRAWDYSPTMNRRAAETPSRDGTAPLPHSVVREAPGAARRPRPV